MSFRVDITDSNKLSQLIVPGGASFFSGDNLKYLGFPCSSKEYFNNLDFLITVLQRLKIVLVLFPLGNETKFPGFPKPLDYLVIPNRRKPAKET